MSHIAKVGRSGWRVRLGLGVLYAILIAGAVTTVYPFLLMLATATTSQTDYKTTTTELTLVPRYFYDDRALFVKYAEDRYANNLDDLNAAHGAEYPKVEEARPPEDIPPEMVKSWETFALSLPLSFKRAGFGEHDQAPSLLLLRYREHLRRTFGGDIGRLNEAWTEENGRFDVVVPPFERTALRDWTPDLENPKVKDWTRFKASLPPHFLVVQTADPLYQRYLRQDVYEEDLSRLNGAWGTEYKAWTQIILPPSPPAQGEQRKDWEAFVRAKFPLRMLSVSPDAFLSWRAFLKSRGRKGADTAPVPPTFPAEKQARSDWATWVASSAPLVALRADSPENRWRAQVAGTSADTAALLPPQAAADWQFVEAHKSEMRREFATRNFRAVAGYMLINGRAVGNTVLFCVLAILGALVVNPLCAYALSRYPLPYAYKVLLFLLATMAFPAEVAMIPNFLLLKDLHLLNTFGALVLPGLASGFSIFLLKGFFDSLPKELYEAGILDGATELTMFRRITIPLSLPIFSVIALNAFTASYGAFLFAMVVCQDPKMWTLMVYLYDLQATAPPYVIMAALTLAAVPTLLVFLLAQKVILRGIILPSFK